MNCPRDFKDLAKCVQEKYDTIAVCASDHSDFDEVENAVYLAYKLLQVKGYEEWHFKLTVSKIDGKLLYTYYFIFAANHEIVISGEHFNSNFVYYDDELKEVEDELCIPNDSDNIEIAFTKDTLGRIKYLKLNPEVLDHKEFHKASKLFNNVRERCARSRHEPKRIMEHIRNVLEDKDKRYLYSVFNEACELGKARILCKDDADGNNKQSLRNLIQNFIDLESEVVSMFSKVGKPEELRDLCIILSCIVDDGFSLDELIEATEMICNNDEFLDPKLNEEAIDWFISEFPIRFPSNDTNKCLHKSCDSMHRLCNCLRRLCHCMILAKIIDIRFLDIIFNDCSKFCEKYEEDVGEIFKKEFEKKFKDRDIDTFWQLREDCCSTSQSTFIPVIKVKKGAKLFVNLDYAVVNMPYCATIKRSNVLLKVRAPTNFWHDEQILKYVMENFFNCTGTVETINCDFDYSTISRSHIQKLKKN